MLCAISLPSMDRVRFITHKGKQVLFIDMSGLPDPECVLIMEQVKKVVTAQPKASVVTLTDWKDSDPGRVALTRMKEVAVYDRPYVKRAAFINSEHLPKIHQQHLEAFSQRIFANHVTKQEALDWLVEED
jgi:hypothetical protein